MTARARAATIAAGVVLMVIGGVTMARADSRFEVSARGGWWSGYPLGDRQFTISGGQVPTGNPVAVFTTDVSIEGGPGGEVGLGWRINRRLVLEATGGIGSLTIESAVRGDLEGAPAITARSSLLQVTVDGAARVELPAAFGGGRWRPFVSGGGGYLRQVHEDRLLIETGWTIFGGGGLLVAPPAATGGFFGRLGFRADVKGVMRAGGVDIEDARRVYLVASGGIVFGF